MIVIAGVNRRRFLETTYQGAVWLLVLPCCLIAMVQGFDGLHGSRRPNFAAKFNASSARDRCLSSRQNGWGRRPPAASSGAVSSVLSNSGLTHLKMSGPENLDETDQPTPSLAQDQTPVPPSSFGESVSIRNRPRKEESGSSAPTTGDEQTPPFQKPTQESSNHVVVASSSRSKDNNDTRSEERIAADNLLRRNKLVALASISLAILSWTWQVLHPVPPIQLLADMERRSADISVVGRNGKPTVVDFWAPWCENCKLSAATMNAIEMEYADRVNFIVVNGDDMVRNGRLVEAFHVDAIPHVAFVEADGTVDTALIGPVPKRILRADLDVLIENSTKDVHDALPYQMLDVFQNRPPQDRRVIF